MHVVLAVTLKDLKELFKEGRMLLMFALTSFIILSLPLEQLDDFALREPVLVQTLLDLFVLYYSIMVVLFISYAAVYRVFYREKNTGTLTSLLATPLSIRQIWFAKTLAVFLAGYGLSALLIIAVTVYLNYVSAAAILLPSDYALVSYFVVNPILMFLLIGILGVLYLLIKDEMKARIGFFILIFGALYFTRAETLPIGWSAPGYLLLAGLGLTVVLGALISLLNNERIILSMDL